MSEHVVRINEDGSMTFLHDDAILASLRNEGSIHIERASDVSYDNAAQGWRVYIPGTKDLLFNGLFSTRAEALEVEKKYLEDRM